jgi:hypothetical protein
MNYAFNIALVKRPAVNVCTEVGNRTM